MQLTDVAHKSWIGDPLTHWGGGMYVFINLCVSVFAYLLIYLVNQLTGSIYIYVCMSMDVAHKSWIGDPLTHLGGGVH